MHFSSIELKIRASSENVPGSPGEKVLSSVEIVKYAVCCPYFLKSWLVHPEVFPDQTEALALPSLLGWGCWKTKNRLSGWAPSQWSELANWTWYKWEVVGFRAKIIAILSLVWPGWLIPQMIEWFGLGLRSLFLPRLVGSGVVVSCSLLLGVKVEDPCETWILSGTVGIKFLMPFNGLQWYWLAFT